MLKHKIKNKLKSSKFDEKLVDLIINYVERHLLMNDDGYYVIRGYGFVSVLDIDDYVSEMIFDVFGVENEVQFIANIIEDIIVHEKLLIIDLQDDEENWFKNGKHHREDGPAIIFPDGHKEWYWKGKLHREDGPAKITTNGTKRWYRNGQPHREDGPAVIYPGGSEEWFKNGVVLKKE